MKRKVEAINELTTSLVVVWSPSLVNLESIDLKGILL